MKMELIDLERRRVINALQRVSAALEDESAEDSTMDEVFAAFGKAMVSYIILTDIPIESMLDARRSVQD